MSADNKAQKRAEKAEKRRQEEQKAHRSVVIYSVIAVVVLAAAAVLLILNSGLLQRSLTALDVNGTKYAAVDLQYYYTSLYSEYSRQYAFDSTTSVKKQVYDEETGQTWYDFLMDQAVERLTRNTALSQKAQAEGHALSEDAQASLNSTLSQLDTTWMSSGAYTSRDAFIRAQFGSAMTYDRLVELLNLEYLASDYAQTKLEGVEHPESDYDAYYAEHAGELDTVTYSQFTCRAVNSTTHEEGESSATMEDPAETLEALKTEQKALAEEIKAKLEGGADPEALADEYSEQLSSSSVSARALGSNLIAYTSYGDWLTDSARKAGDVTLSGQDLDGAANYYVIRFEDRELDQEQTHSIRHLLVRAGTGSEPTQEEYDEAEQKAQGFWDEWKAGEATEETFATLAAANSSDSSSAQNGGLIANITSSSSYTENFQNWALDPARKEGDVGLVKSEYGWHLMYYVSTNEPIWRQTTLNALQTQDFEALADDASQGWTVTRGVGMNFINA